MARTSIRLLALTLLVAAAPGLLGSEEPPPRPLVGRSMVATRYGIVAASQPLAARAGVQILERGGNAIDAAIAANAAMGLMEPMSNGVGGDLFAIVYDARSGKLYGLNSSGWAATGLTPELIESRGAAVKRTPEELRDGFSRMPDLGVYTVTVPGAVAGWHALRTRFGTLPFKDLLAPAIFYAREGFPVSEVIAGMWNAPAAVKLLSSRPGAAHTYLPGGRPPRVGEVFRNPDLAGTLQRIADADGRDGFYRGATAESILASLGRDGSPMTAADLSEFEPEWVEPISTTYRGWTVSEMPPQGQGIAVLMMLNLMERFPLGEYGFHSADALHVMIEAKKLAYADVLRYIGDPRYSRVPVGELLDKGRAAERFRLIDRQRANCAVEPSRLSAVTTARGNDTIYLTTVDRDGNMVSLIQSNYAGFGSGIVPDAGGFMLQNRGALFSLERDQPNTLAPRKRPLHTIIPGFMQKGDVRISFGIMGGWNQAQAHAQFVADIADYGFTPQEALEAGRFTKLTFGGCDVQVEALVPAGTRKALETRGHVITVVKPRSSTFGWGQAILANADGVHFGASEPRHDGAAIPEGPPVFGPAARKGSR